MTEHNSNNESSDGKGSDLNLSLPEYGKRKRGDSAYGVLVGLSVVIVVLLVAALAILLFSGGKATQSPAGMGHDAESLKKLALKLGDRGLPEQAARTWVDYVEAADLTQQEKAQKLALAAREMQSAGKYEDAIALYFRADELGPGEEVKASINRGVHECFGRLGKYSDLYYELKDRTGLGSEEVEEGSKVVAEIGPEKITLREFERKLDEEIQKMAAGMGGGRAGEYTSYLREQIASAEAKRRKLSEMISREVLVREAKERKIDQTAAFKEKLGEIADQLQAQEVLQSEIAKIGLSEGDYKLYYEANKSKYTDPEGAKISRILIEDEKAAEELLDTLKTAEDFAKAAKEKSADAETKESGGELAGEVRPGQWVPGIGTSEELNDAIFAADAGAILNKPFKTDDGFNLVMVREKTPQQQKSYEEVKDRVKAEYDRQKQQEAADALIRSLFEKYNVTLHHGVIGGETPGGAAKDDTKTPDDEKKDD